MSKPKTIYTGKDVMDFVNSYVENEQKKADSFHLIELMQEWSGSEPKMWDRPLSDLITIITNMQAVTKEMLQFLGFLQEKQPFHSTFILQQKEAKNF